MGDALHRHQPGRHDAERQPRRPAALAENTALEIIASGGVTGLDDLRALKELEPLGMTGVIAGRALYEKRFTVAEARAVLDAPPAATEERR